MNTAASTGLKAATGALLTHAEPLYDNNCPLETDVIVTSDKLSKLTALAAVLAALSA